MSGPSEISGSCLLPQRSQIHIQTRRGPGSGLRIAIFIVSILFLKDLKFLLNMSFTFLISVTPRYFMLFVTIVKGNVFLISFLTSYDLYRRATDFFELILYPATY